MIKYNLLSTHEKYICDNDGESVCMLTKMHRKKVLKDIDQAVEKLVQSYECIDD